MPRLSPALIRQATLENPLLTLLLQVCRDLPSARNELRWLREHAHDAVHAKRYASRGPPVPHADQGVETPQEIGGPGTSEKAQAEDGHVPTESTKQGSGTVSKPEAVWRMVNRRHLIKSNQTYVTFRINSGEAEVATEANATSHVQAHDNQASEEVSCTVNAGISDRRNSRSRTTHQKRTYVPKEKKGRRIAKISGRQFVTFRTWSPHSNHQLRLLGETVQVPLSSHTVSNAQAQAQKLLAHNVDRRSKGMPLQYIMGSQPFGNLDILCRRGVLIPRPETEMYTEKAAKLLLAALPATQSTDGPWWQDRSSKVRILDLCTGTGCIALLLHSLLKPIDPTKPSLPPGLDLEIVGLDINPRAVRLARKNLHHSVSQKLLHSDAIHSVSFQQVDVRALEKKQYKEGGSDDQLRKTVNAAAAGVSDEDIDSSLASAPWDMVIANPPYVGPKDYELGGKTEPSVRDYEPKEALVPVVGRHYKASAEKQADLFYRPLHHIARAVGAQLMVMEVGDSSQAARVGSMVVGKAWGVNSRSSDDRPQAFSWDDGMRLEAWGDDSAVRVLAAAQTLSTPKISIARNPDPEVSDRAIVVWSGKLADWRCRTLPMSNRTDSAPKEVRAKSKHAKEKAIVAPENARAPENVRAPEKVRATRPRHAKKEAAIPRKVMSSARKPEANNTKNDAPPSRASCSSPTAISSAGAHEKTAANTGIQGAMEAYLGARKRPTGLKKWPEDMIGKPAELKGASVR
ncbi:hypothetical protein A1O7_02756 [Cladophialophora yegresii CBS 114405]|uniref:Type II methyltransferase M.TaqI-like domain-containing protein n=1 Tax=Cladophialophora yegresii CBS 114405 TaxID=1182544 RepID=W9W2N4_9EURO|nr:uncharacterized protein A1O7_02756 [Cladophialophora yegresii CBS 114405]EXJ62322.1 hypothetical protein A1O7_02756 [Cladophialophora yegresii CBS 114405]